MGSALNVTSLPAMLAQDVAAASASGVVPKHKIATSLSDRVLILKERYQLPNFPIPPKVVTSITERAAETHFHATPKLSDASKALKPSFDLATYLAVDSRPAVCIRARIRLGVALSFFILHRYKKRANPHCPYCPPLTIGNTKHILLECPHHGRARQMCMDRLQRLSYPALLTWDLLRGLPPPPPSGLDRERAFLATYHKQCLAITADFLVIVSNHHFL